jgi:peptidoglycan/xylan/chitin deacetylase (PgdA/CDA1 family)
VETSYYRLSVRHPIPVLLYHHIGQPKPGAYPYLSVSRERFSVQIQWLLHEGYRFLRVSDFLALHKGDTDAGEKSILLTFDDAFADLEENAFRFLEENRISATIFIVTSQIGGVNAWDQARSWTHSIPLLSREQIKFWASRGIEFGAHSHTHSDLRTLTKAQIEEEVIRSKEELENVLSREVLSFAYPFGSYNQTVRDVVKTNFGVAFTTRRGLNHSYTDIHELRRTAPRESDGQLEMWLRARVGWTPADRMRNLRNRLRSS